MQAYPSLPPLPPETARAAKAVYSQNNFYLSTGSRLDILLADIQFNSCTSPGGLYHLGKPLLALVTFFQYLEKLSDRQAAHATGARIDWKYALHLSMNYPGLNLTDLCDFRQCLLREPIALQVFQQLLDRLSVDGPCPEFKDQTLDALDLLNEVCLRTRLDKVATGMRHVLQALAIRSPEWLRSISLPYWYNRYGDAAGQPDLTQSMQQLRTLAEVTGADIVYLLDAIFSSDIPELAGLPEVQELHEIRSEQFDPICLDGVNLYPYCYF
ncbi:MAG TPA: transposase, partial [Anaerolineales bacterium]|nr:transposase [Anaerolineales bacterium]